MKRKVSGTMLTLSLIIMLTLAFDIPSVKNEQMGIRVQDIDSTLQEKGPPLDVIYLNVTTERDMGIRDVAAGTSDVFLWSASQAVYNGLPPEVVKNLTLIRTASGYWSLIFNPVQDNPAVPGVVKNETDHKLYFNPFAIREIRYQMNWLINRKCIVEEILAGGGAAMYSPVQPSEPANRFVEGVYSELGLDPEGDEKAALSAINATMLSTATTLAGLGHTLALETDATGTWWRFTPKGGTKKTVEVIFYIRIEDERLEEGRHIADLIEKAHIKVKRLERDRRTCLLTLYYTDPKDYLWNTYTEGWVSMAEWLYPEWSIAQMYAPWYTNMPGWGEPDWWNYQNATIDELSQRLCYGTPPFASVDEYWEDIRKVVNMGIQESVRIFVAETWEYFPVNPRVKNITSGVVSGLWPMWPFRTATTPDRILRATEFSAAGVLFMSPWNPVGGFTDVYSELVWRYVRDYADYPHPRTGEPISVRTTQDTTINNATHANIDVPPTAVVYNSLTDSWQTVGTGRKAKARVVFNNMFSNWHHGKMMTIADVMNVWGFMWEWATEDYPGDPYYNARYASGAAPTLEQIGGIEILNSTAIAVYGSYTHPVSIAVTADFYASWPTIPWEVLAALEYVVVNDGPVSEKPYGWYQVPGVEWIDMILPDHVTDIKEAMNILKSKEYISPYTKVPGYAPTVDEAIARYQSAFDWATTYNHVAISNGPFWVKEYNPATMTMELRAFRDPTYPFEPDYWQKELRLSTAVYFNLNPNPANIGQTVTLKGILVDEFSEPLSNEVVKLYARPVAGSWKYVTSLTTNSYGIFLWQAKIPIKGTFIFAVYYPGSETYKSTYNFAILIVQ